MITRCVFLTKKKDMTLEEFYDYWRNVHAPITSKMKNLRGYELHLVSDREQRHEIARGPVEIDGYAELFFDDYHDMEEGMASVQEAYQADLAKFAENWKELVFVKKMDTEVPEELKGEKFIKRMSFLGRGEGISAEKFQYEWWGQHSRMVKLMPGYAGYAQNLVVDRLIDGKHVSYEEFPVEGMVEFWFKNMDDFNTCYDSEEFAKTAAHGKTFLGSVTTYLTEDTVCM